MRIHKEGIKILVITFIILISILALAWYLWELLALTIGLVLCVPFYAFTLRFFRSPKRKANTNEQAILSPCDGKVVVIEEVDEPEFLKTRCIQVSIFMSVWNVHINWYPTSGEVIYQKHHHGKYLVAWEPKSSTENERTTIAIQHPNGHAVLFRQVAGYLARRIVCYAKKGANAKQGEEMGFIKFGSRVDLYLPLGSNIEVNLNQRVTGSQSIIATLPQHKQ